MRITAHDALTARVAATWPHTVIVHHTAHGWVAVCTTCPARTEPAALLSHALDELVVTAPARGAA